MDISNICGIYARNEAHNLETVFHTLNKQTKPFNAIVFLNDGSTDNTNEVLYKIVEHTKTYIDIIESAPHENYLKTGKLHITVNKLLERIYDYNTRYFTLIGGDTLLNYRYNEDMLRQVSQDRKLVCSSGRVKGETFRKDVPRGTGRVYNMAFMKRFCRPLPANVIWESYPLYKALSMGLHIRAFYNPSMIVQRRTRSYKTYYGYAMKQLGYFPLYAYLKMLRDLFKDKSAINVFRAYRHALPVYDENIRRWLTRYQIHRLLRLDF